MRGFCARFAALMAETLHYAGVPAGLETPLNDVNARLAALAEEERALPAPDSAPLRQELNLARFAVAAWADEQILSSPRPDAAAWAGMSLQYKYFATSEAGTQFYRELEKCLDACGVARRVAIEPPAPDEDSAADGEAERENPALVFGDLETEKKEGEQFHDLDLAERIAAAAPMPDSTPGREAVKVFALCLLCGFRGSLYNDPGLLARIRKSCRALFPRAPKTSLPPAQKRTKQFLIGLERASWVLIPLAVCVIFALYCGGVLANAPFRGF